MLISNFVSGLAAVALAVMPSVMAYADPGACSGDCWAHDPALVKRASDGKYFRFNTGSKIGIYTASTISGPWTYQGAAIPAGSKIDLTGNDDLWAPEVTLIDGTYYLYYTVSAFASQVSSIGYATSTTMEVGSWTDHGAVGIASKAGSAYNAIDSNLIQATDGTWYTNFGSFWTDIFQVKMSTPPTKTSGTPVNIVFNNTGTQAVEGSFMYYRSPYYYVFFSSGICCGYDTSKPAAGAEYAINVCRSTTINGGYVDATGKSCLTGGGTKVLASHGTVYGPGGQGVLVDSANSGTVLYYHYADTTVGLGDGDYKFGWNKISWSTGWPVAV